jgi:hypothetical protein
MDDKKAEKSGDDFSCEKCAFKCSRNCDWERHVLTTKHKKRTFGGQKSAPFYNNIFVCDCGKEYKYRQGLWKHEKICPKKMSNFQMPYFSNNEELIQTILKENHEVKQLLLEQNMKIIDLANKNTIINNTTNNMNNTNNTNNFNLQVFLNVQCKDALNMSEFVDSLQLQISDLEDTGRLGYIEGVSKIFINGLKGLDVSERPIHCSDVKRETIYIKDKDIWEKENNERNRLKLAIKTITSKNIKQIPLWQKANPDCFDSTSKKNDKYLKIVSNAMNGLTEEETEKNYNKIISRIAKETVIQKELF